MELTPLSDRIQCRHCNAPLTQSFCDLGMSPLANSYVPLDKQSSMEPFYPLHTYVCHSCHLVQLQEFENPQHIFGDYAYFSSYSTSWLAHAKAYTEMMTARFGFNAQSQVVEIASNDGYLLQYFQKQGVPVLGIEPAANVAKVAEANDIPSIVKFFGVATATELVAQGLNADLLLGNNVLAHVPDINDFVAGMKIILKPTGIITMEFPHLLQLIANDQFDTIYHEHFSYLSFITVERIFGTFGIRLFDVEEVSTHGGSLRIFGCHADNAAQPNTPRVAALKAKEVEFGLAGTEVYSRFSESVKATKRRLLTFLIEAKNNGKTIVGYGAPAKGNTLLNYCGIGTDLLDYTVDASPHKQNHLLPGTRIPVFHPDKIKETQPDFVLILPWNLKDEIMDHHSYVKSWGGTFIVPLGELVTST